MATEFDRSDKRLAHLESVIKKYRQDFYSVGKALKEIRDGAIISNCLLKALKVISGCAGIWADRMRTG
jgi:hypothetical protein